MTELSSKVIFIDKRKTSMRLANAEWEAIDSICKRENIKRNNLLEMINARKDAKMGTYLLRPSFFTNILLSFVDQRTHAQSRQFC